MARDNALKQSYIKYIYQMEGKLVVQNSVGGAVWYNAGLIYEWARKKFVDVNIPDKVCTFSRSRNGQSVHFIYENEDPYFCMLVEHPDDKVAGRIWSIEAELLADNDDVRIAVKVYCSTPVDSDADTPLYSLPNFLKDIAKKNGIVDVERLTNRATYLDSADKIERLRNDLIDASRKCPIVVVTECGDETASGYLVNPNELAKKLYLYAHVYALPICNQQLFDQAIGSTWTVYGGAIRTYYPRLDFEEDATRHPYATPSRIMAATYTKQNDELTEGAAFVYRLADRIYRDNGYARIDFAGLGHQFYYASARALSKHVAYSTNDMRRLREAYAQLQEESDAEIQKKDEEYLSAIQNVYDLEDEVRECRETIRKQDYRIQLLQDRINHLKGNGAAPEETIPIPDNYDELPEWIKANFPVQIKLNSRAERSLKEAQFEDVELVYRSLMLLGNEYYQMRMGEQNMDRAAFEKKCEELGVEESPCFSGGGAGEKGDKYYVKSHGQKILIDRHITKGTSRDPKFCMRIYFYWDDYDSQVVVCYLPQHQDIWSS